LKQGLISYMAVLGIIYCFTQKESEEVTTELKLRGIKTGCYHANVSPKQKSHIHEMWLANKILVSKITVSKDRMLPC
jgi:ATP-dependent DNA helicase Q1